MDLELKDNWNNLEYMSPFSTVSTNFIPVHDAYLYSVLPISFQGLSAVYCLEHILVFFLQSKNADFATMEFSLVQTKSQRNSGGLQ